MPIAPLPPNNHTVTKLLPSTNLAPPKRLVFSQDTTKGILATISYRHIPGDNTLTPGGSLTMMMVLQVNPTPLTPGLTPVPDRKVTSLTDTIVT